MNINKQTNRKPFWPKVMLLMLKFPRPKTRAVIMMSTRLRKDAVWFESEHTQKQYLLSQGFNRSRLLATRTQWLSLALGTVSVSRQEAAATPLASIHGQVEFSEPLTKLAT